MSAQQPSAQSVRDLAVMRVDQRHGFTMEFAPDPLAHRWEYDAEELLLNEWTDPEPIERVVTRHEHAGVSSTFTLHLTFARCPECTHATVGLVKPWVINHRKDCGVPRGGYGAV